ncbi:MAG: heavy-metal-associated domain-containing protein [Dechloromonas sp.]|nr:MAG: heavy-metal-associated domain-containing protein [Dechloromonas sp.]
MSAPSVNLLSRQILVLHKSAGHVRFALPEALANPGSAAVIKAALLRIPGVRLVQVDAGTGKLGVHYDPIACSLPQLALVLKCSLEAAATAAARPTAASEPPASGIGEIGQQLARGLSRRKRWPGASSSVPWHNWRQRKRPTAARRQAS